MDSSDSSAREDPSASLQPWDRPEARLPIIEFEQRLHRHCAQTWDDDVFWEHVSRDLGALAAGMSAVEIQRFETSADYLLSRLGLPAWTIVKVARGVAG